MCATVSVGRTSVVFRSIFLSLLQSSHPGLARAPIMCSHFPHGNEHVITCLARLFLASCTALELIHEPRNSRPSPSLSKNSAAQVVAAGFSQLSASWSWSIQLHPQRVLSKIHLPYFRNNCAAMSFGLTLHHMTQCLSLWSSVRHFSLSSGRRLSHRIPLCPCWGPQKGLDGRPAPSKNGAAVIVDSPTTTLALMTDCSARRMNHVGDLYPLASSIFWWCVSSCISLNKSRGGACHIVWRWFHVVLFTSAVYCPLVAVFHARSESFRRPYTNNVIYIYIY